MVHILNNEQAINKCKLHFFGSVSYQSNEDENYYRYEFTLYFEAMITADNERKIPPPWLSWKSESGVQPYDLNGVGSIPATPTQITCFVDNFNKQE